MPYWSIICFHCDGYISDALLECLPAVMKTAAVFNDLFNAKPGVALACPYCNELLGFNDHSVPQLPETGWPVFRYGEAELRTKMLSDGESKQTSLTEWALRHRFTQPGKCDPFGAYTYAEQAPANETVP